MSNKFLEVVEYSENFVIVSGVFHLFETTGIPLDLIIEYLYKKNLIPAWDDFYHEAQDAGVNIKSVIIRIQDSIQLLERLKKIEIDN